MPVHPMPRSIVLGLAAALASAGCVAPAPVDDADPDGTLTTVIAGEPSADPSTTATALDASIILMVFEPLVRFEPKTLQPVPAAAKALPEVSADGLTYRITIRDDAKYSDGSPVQAKDFAFALSRLCDPAIKGPFALIVYAVVGCEDWSRLDPKRDAPDKLRAAKEKFFASGVRANGASELTISLTRPAGYFTSILGLWALVPVRESDIAHGGDQWTEPATYIGNGPFVLSAWKHLDRLVFSPNRHYRRPSRLKEWTKVIVDEPAIALQEYRHDEVDAFFASSAGSQFGGAAGQLLREIEGDPSLKRDLVLPANLCAAGFLLNTRRPPLDDPVVRLALAKAVDRDRYVREILGGLGTPAVSWIPPGLPAYDADDTVQRFDPAEARRLLSTSKYAGSDALRSIVIQHNLAAFSRMRSEWIRDQWRTNLGLDVRTEQLDGPALGQLYRKEETIPYTTNIGWCLDYPDPQESTSVVFRSGSGVQFRNTGYSDAAFDRLVDEADRSQDQARRDELYRSAARLLTERAVVVVLNSGRSISLRKPWVRGVTDSPLDYELSSIAGMEKIYIAKRGR
jgi:oligopeptide transport system substrate-binding protein